MHIAVTVVALLAVQTPAQESRTAIDPELREIALRALIQEADTPRLIAMYDAEKNADHRELILRHLSSRGDQQARQKLVAVARQDADLELRERAVRLLGAQGESPLLIELYDEQKDREIQEVILRQLGQRSDAAARQKLLAIVKGETDDGLQEVAVRALATHAPTALLIELFDTVRDADVRETIIRELGRRKDDAAREKLLAIVKG
jgi:uncharacterized protein YfeS